MNYESLARDLLHERLRDANSDAESIESWWIQGGEDSVRAVVGLRTGMQAYVAKFYRNGTGHDAFDKLFAIAAVAHGFSAPRALCFDRRNECLLQQFAPGFRLDSPAGSAELLRHVQGAGAALAALHAGPAVQGWGPLRLEDHLRRGLRPHPTILARAFPQHAKSIEASLNRWRNGALDWNGRYRPVTIHGDFHLRQLHADGDRIWILDWDAAAVGDPAFDVAFFLAYLQCHLDEPTQRSAAAAFTGGYGTAAVTGMYDRVAVYLEYNHLRRACRRFRLRDDNWESQLLSHLGALSSSCG